MSCNYDQSSVEFRFSFGREQDCRRALTGTGHSIVLHCLGSARLIIRLTSSATSAVAQSESASAKFTVERPGTELQGQQRQPKCNGPDASLCWS